jgi:hypothetical protein
LDAQSLLYTGSRHANIASRHPHTVLPRLPASGHQARGSPASHNKTVNAGVGNWAGAGSCWQAKGNRAWGGVTLGIPVGILLCRSNDLTRFGHPTDTQEQPLASKAERKLRNSHGERRETSRASAASYTPEHRNQNEKHAFFLTYLLRTNRVSRAL